MDRIAVVGASGLVGVELVNLLKTTNIPPKKIRLIARNEKYDFHNTDIVFLCTPSDTSKVLTPLALSQGAIVIDLSSAHRLFSNAQLYHPNIKQDLTNTRLFSIPNCIVSIMLSVLAPLHAYNPIQRICMATYQAASGAGKNGLSELLEKKTPSIFPHPYEHNLFIHENFIEEEEKIKTETEKLLNIPKNSVHVRSIRVPVIRAHSMSLNVTFKKPFSEETAQKILHDQDGISFLESPTPKFAEGKNTVFYGPVRKDLSMPNTLDLFICGDQILRGSALTAFNCYEMLCKTKV